MSFFAAFFLGVACIICMVASCLYFHERGYRCGKSECDNCKAGYDRGYKEADAWWLNAEKEVDQARQKIWKEEAP